ncbi:MAG: YceI family protein [Akkermansiaceae bacterium]|jgi:polyisoprenoid-binding protein YceI
MKRILAIGASFTTFALPLAGAGFVVDPGKSSITVKADATGGGFTGTLKKYKAEIEGNPTTLKPESAKVSWLFADLDTANKDRDAKMLKWLDVGSNPGGEFSLKRVFDKTVLGKTQTYAFGTIKIHGVSKDIVFPINTARNGKALTIAGQAVLDTTDFKLPLIRMALIATVKPKLTVIFNLTGTIK